MVSYATRSSAASSAQRPQPMTTYEKMLQRGGGTIQDVPAKYQRFNEEFDSKSTQERMARTHSQMSAANLAAFTKARPFLKVVGTPNLNATASSRCSASQRASIFSYHSGRKAGAEAQGAGSEARSQRSAASYCSGVRVHRSAAAEQHKRRILDVVNQLNDEELERVSEMLKASASEGHAQKPADAPGEAGEGEGDDAFEAGTQAELENAAGEEFDTVDELRVRVDTPEQTSKAPSKQSSIVSSLKRQLFDEQEAR